MVTAEKEKPPKQKIEKELVNTFKYIGQLEKRLQKAKNGGPKDNAFIDNLITTLDSSKAHIITALPNVIFEASASLKTQPSPEKLIVSQEVLLKEKANQDKPKITEKAKPTEVRSPKISESTENQNGDQAIQDLEAEITDYSPLEEESIAEELEDMPMQAYQEDDLDSPEDVEEQNDLLNDPIRQYLQEIGKHPLLKKEEEVNLGKQIFAAKLALHNLQAILNLLPGDQRVEVSNLLTKEGTGKILLENLNKTIKRKDEFKNTSSENVNKDPLQALKTTLDEIEINDELTQNKIAELLTIKDSKVREEATYYFKDKQRVIFDKGSQAFDRFWVSNLRLVVGIAKKHTGRGLGLLDMIQEGNVGLRTAIADYDYRQGFKFSTYATWWVKQAITRAIADKSRTIRIPVHMHEAMQKLKKMRDKREKEEGRDPGIAEVARELGMNEETMKRAFSRTGFLYLETPINEDEDIDLEAVIEDKHSVSPENEALNNMLKVEVSELLNTLTSREQRVLRLRFGLEDNQSRTLEQVGEEFNFTREYIRQIQQKALRKLRYRLSSKNLRDYVD